MAKKCVEIFQRAMDCLLSREVYNIQNDCYEGNLTPHLANYLKHLLFTHTNGRICADCEEDCLVKKLGETPFDIDCEYNKRNTGNGVAQKSEARSAPAGSTGIRPDIIVHSRVNATDNFLIIEMKKNNINNDCTACRLKTFTDQEKHYKYSIGFYVSVSKNSSNQPTYEARIFINGQELSSSRIPHSTAQPLQCGSCRARHFNGTC